MARPSLEQQTAARILDHVRERGFAAGQHLAGQPLADALRLSRAPVARALKRLEAFGMVSFEAQRGYFLAVDADDLPEAHADLVPPAEPEEDVYGRIAEDRLSGRLSDSVSETELMRLYGLSRARLLKVLNRIAQEGWIERRPGNGWEFPPPLRSRDSYEKAYQFRISIETQAVLLPNFRPNLPAFRAAREEQTAILNGGYERMTRSQLFEMNSGFHEMLVACSQNEFFVDALARVNRLRRLLEYQLTEDRSRLPMQSREHLLILDLLESGDRTRAAEFLRAHIAGASAIKTPHVGQD